MREKQLAAWRKAVADGQTHLGFESWIADQDDIPRYIVAIGEVSVYQYIDLDDGSVVRVVIDDSTMTSIDEQMYRYANSGLLVMIPGVGSNDMPAEDEIGRAMEILQDSDGPSWEFGW